MFSRFIAIFSSSAVLASAQFKIDLDSNTGGPLSTKPGWTSLNATNVSNSVTVDGVVFQPFSADGSRVRSSGGVATPNNLTSDFVFDDGSGQAVGLFFGGAGDISAGDWVVRIWIWDASASFGNSIVGYRKNNSETIVSTSVTADPVNPAITFTFTSDGTSAYDVFVRENNSSNQARLNAVELRPAEGPSQLDLSNNLIANSISIGSTVGCFSTIDPTPGDSFSYSLVSGTGDDNNGEFEISGNLLLTDRDLTSLTGPLSIRVRTTDNQGDFLESAFSITLIPDSDADGLIDNWELSYFPDLATADGSGHNDADALTNLEEQALGTDPTLADTDGDGLNDDLEDGTGIYNGPGDSGSSPLLSDTDGDGLSDSVELSASNGHVTNPNLGDSDNDGFNDPFEINDGTDPNDQNDFPAGLLPMRLNEVLSRNSSGIRDGFGEREDWIEIYNPNVTSVDLTGYHLTDDPAILNKWTFPGISISANGYLLVFASGLDSVDPDSNPHTNFKLSADGEYLAIVRPNGLTVEDSFGMTLPEQFTNISYGIEVATSAPRFFDEPTPGSLNAFSGFLGVVKDTNFSVDRGFYRDPISLNIASDTVGATIRYTTDGSPPSPSHGTIFTPNAPLDISTTANIRAMAFKNGWLSTNVDTHSYLYIDDVVQQPADPAGWPADWGYDGQVDSQDGGGSGIVPSDYEMDPRVVNNTNGLAIHTVQEALLDIPSVSISMNHDDLIGPENGIYNHSRSRWERVCSMEYLHPDGTPGFQEDVKIEMHGNSSRTPWRMQKHSMRITFSSAVGKPKLDADLFPDSEVTEFNKLVLRACFTDSWALNSWSSSRYRPNDSQYIRDVWMKNSMRDMDHVSSHGNFVHVYLNGLYFGLHNMCERLEDDHFAQHHGGETEDWDVYTDFSSAPSRWNTMISIINGNIASNPVYDSAKDYIDMENYADYMLLHFYADAEDWPTHNGYAAANADSHDGKFRFYVWDQEIALDKFTSNRYDSSGGGGRPLQRLRLNAEFRMLFADRVQKHLFNGGALSQQSSIDRYLDLTDHIDKAIVAESARWGDTQANTPYGNTAGSSTDPDSDHYPPTLNSPIYFTREQHWTVERDNVTGHYIPSLYDANNSFALVNELRSEDLYPSIDPPVFSQHGGVVSPGHGLVMTAGSGQIYYTLDGSDPRNVGGSIGASATMIASGGSATLTQTTVVKARNLIGGEWSALTEAEFIVGSPASASNFTVTEIYYNPPGSSEETEFIELMNIDGANSIDLTNVSFTGITYTFPAGTTLAPLERIMVVKDQVAFAAEYNTAGLNIAGEFATGKLDNNGEEIAIIAEDGVTDIRRFTYDDAPEWPTSPDGDGFSLVLISPESNPDHGDPLNWRSSTLSGGNPGLSDAAPAFVGDVNFDEDGDQLSAFMEYALGTDDRVADPNDAPQMGVALFDGGGGVLREHLTISYQRNLAADDVVIDAQASHNLLDWTIIGTEFVSSVHNGDGTENVIYRSLVPMSAHSAGFIRLKAQLRQESSLSLPR